MFRESEEGGPTTTCEFVCESVPTEDDSSASPSYSGGEMKRAVGRGLLVDGSLEDGTWHRRGVS